MTVVSRSPLLGSPAAPAVTVIYPSDFWLSDQQQAFGRRRASAANAVPNAGCAGSSDRSVKINRDTLASAAPRSAGRRKPGLIIRCAILFVVCPAALGVGLAGGALIAQNQPISSLEPGGFALEAPRFFAVETNAGQVAPLALVRTTSEALPGHEM
jgi:hypothetical protein